MNGQMNERFSRLVKSLSLKEIRPMDLHSQHLADAPIDSEVQMGWAIAFADGDPLAISHEFRVFRPRYEFTLKHGDTVLFQHTSIFVLAFEVTDAAAFEELWVDEALRKVFMEKQLQHTMWPIFRQQVLDGMSRLGMRPVALPWIM